jgi:branched-chain amino acid transport system ATP-binding protein
MIEVRNLNAWYGHAPVLHDISLNITAGSSVAILGRNGMGKTSLLRCLVGLETPRWTGSIKINGLLVRIGKPHAVVARGYSYVPEGRGLFRSLTVAENLRVARRVVSKPNWPIQRIHEMFPVLRERSTQTAGTLSGGQQQMLALGRALANEPDILVLDEPSFGLAPAVIGMLEQSLIDIAASGVTMITVEQHLNFALNVSNATVVIEKGRIIAEYASADLRRDPKRVESILSLGGSRGPGASPSLSAT